MCRVTVAISAFTGVQPVSTALAITRAVFIPRIDIQQAPEDIGEMQPGCFSQLHNFLFPLTYCASASTHGFSGDTTDTLSLDGSQILSASNLSAIGVKPRQVKLTMPVPGRADTEVFSLCAKQHRSLIQRWCPVLSKFSKQAKRFVDTADPMYSLIQAQRNFSAVQASQSLFKSYA